jgi:hypothetical protein
MTIYMRWKAKMTPSTLSTILNSAPMVIQGASKLIKLIREQGNNKPDESPEHLPSIESLQSNIRQLEQRLAATDESNIEQIKLIEELARQNEALAASMSKGLAKLNLLSITSVLASLIAIAALLLVLLP